jgi:hypothetical protein
LAKQKKEELDITEKVMTEKEVIKDALNASTKCVEAEEGLQCLL